MTSMQLQGTSAACRWLPASPPLLETIAHTSLSIPPEGVHADLAEMPPSHTCLTPFPPSTLRPVPPPTRTHQPLYLHQNLVAKSPPPLASRCPTGCQPRLQTVPSCAAGTAPTGASGREASQ